MFRAAYRRNDTEPASGGGTAPPGGENRDRARSGRGARLGPYRRAAGTRRAGLAARCHGRLVDRHAGRRLLRRRQARHARGLRPLLDPAPRARPPGFLFHRQRPHRRRAAAREARGRAWRAPHRGFAGPVRRRRHRDRRRPRDLAPARPAGRRDPRLLCLARRIRAGEDQRTLAVRRRDRQSGSGQRRARARRGAGHRAQHFERPRWSRHRHPGPVRPPGAPACGRGAGARHERHDRAVVARRKRTDPGRRGGRARPAS